jgi:DNA mismatch repair ATPase MutS
MTARLLDTDEQTLDDLGIFGRQQAEGIFGIYNHTHSRGGERLLREWFKTPLADRDEINNRLDTIRQFAVRKTEFPLSGSVLDRIEKYLSHAQNDGNDGLRQNALNEKETIDGVGATIELLQVMKKFADDVDVAGLNAYSAERNKMVDLLSEPALAPALKEQLKNKRSYSAVTAYDQLFRNRVPQQLEQLLRYVYRLDVYLSVGRLAAQNGYVYPRVLEPGTGTLVLKGVVHPALKNAVGNDVEMRPGSNLIFLTGANMAGKSTLLRSISVAVYLAHMGFPLAAKMMEFSVMDGMYTTVNLPDNLGIGASHFFMEVLRAKKVAAELSKQKSLFVIFDELFRGTNVTDAHEATVAITSAFARKRNSLFIISSHIVEAGEVLQKEPAISFQFMPTHMNGNVPEYTYVLRRGITDDRHGMVIIQNEGILDILREGKKAC